MEGTSNLIFTHNDDLISVVQSLNKGHEIKIDEFQYPFTVTGKNISKSAEIARLKDYRNREYRITINVKSGSDDEIGLKTKGKPSLEMKRDDGAWTTKSSDIYRIEFVDDTQLLSNFTAQDMMKNVN